MPVTPDDLVIAARQVRENAYAPFSGFLVGAALLADDEVFLGCNVENASFGLTQCAERNAVGAALSAGCRRFTALAIASSGGVVPCGACRQVLAEFEPTLLVYLLDVDAANSPQQVRLQELFPHPFSGKDVGGSGAEAGRATDC